MERTSSPGTNELGHVRAGITQSVRALMARYPRVSADQLLRESGLDSERLGDRNATHSQHSMLTFLESAARATGDEGFAIELVKLASLKDLDVLGYVVLHSPTLGVALENGCRYLSVQQTMGKLSLRHGVEETRIIYSIGIPVPIGLKQHCELALAAIVKMCREIMGRPDWAPREVRFKAPEPANVVRFEQFFGAPVRFRQAENALLIPTSDLDSPLKSPDPDLLPILRRHADDLLAQIPTSGDLRSDVRRQITELLRSGSASIESVATRLKTTPRSIQRRLQEDGTSFQQLLAEARLALAQQYLTDYSLSLTEIAFLLGYSELSSFSRAFRRWAGESPIDFRKRSR